MKKGKLFLVFASFLFLGIATSHAQSSDQERIITLGQHSKYLATQGEQLVVQGDLTKDGLKLRMVLYRTILKTVKGGSSVDDAIDSVINQLSDGLPAGETASMISNVSLGHLEADELKDEVYDLFE